jgi:hypothetical protein
MSAPKEIALKNLAKAKSVYKKGRPKGLKNKFTDLKKEFLSAFETIGGGEELARWAQNKRNRTAFYGMIAKMLPKEVNVESKGGFQLIINGSPKGEKK